MPENTIDFFQTNSKTIEKALWLQDIGHWQYLQEEFEEFQGGSARSVMAKCWLVLLPAAPAHWPAVQPWAGLIQNRTGGLRKRCKWKRGACEKELKITHKMLLINTRSRKVSSFTSVTSLKTNLTGPFPADLQTGTTVTLAVSIHQGVNLPPFCSYLFGHLREKQREETVRAARWVRLFIDHTEGCSHRFLGTQTVIKMPQVT